LLTLLAAGTTATLSWMLRRELLADKQVALCLTTSNSDHSNVVSHRPRPGNSWAVFHILNFPVALCGPLGVSPRAGSDPWAGVCALIYHVLTW